MTDRPDTILLQGMRLEGRHGATDEERALPQLLEVDLVVEADLRAAGRSDDLADTVDYGPLLEICRTAVEVGQLPAAGGDRRRPSRSGCWRTPGCSRSRSGCASWRCPSTPTWTSPRWRSGARPDRPAGRGRSSDLFGAPGAEDERQLDGRAAAQHAR